jgi:hypothetical protein
MEATKTDVTRPSGRYRYWNRCDVCGRFIAFKDFDDDGGAERVLVYPDSLLTRESYVTRCKEC